MRVDVSAEAACLGVVFGEEDDDTGVFPDNHPNQWPRHDPRQPSVFLRQPSEYGTFAENSRCSAMKPLKVKKLKRKPARPARALFPERRFPPCVSVVVVSAMGMMSPTWKWRPLGSTAQVLGSVLGFIGKPFQGWYFRLGDAALDLYFQA